jgi:predicted nucleotidyltransferase
MIITYVEKSKEITSIESIILDCFQNDAIFIYTFGSINTDFFQPQSDVDVAIYLKKFSSDFNKMNYIQNFSLKMDRDVDIIILNLKNFVDL